MAKGTIAKEYVTKKIYEAFGQDMIGEYDRKLYLWADDGGEKVQICIALTCPKVYRGVEETTGLMTFDEPSAAPAAPKTAQITPEENKTLEDLMKKFGI